MWYVIQTMTGHEQELVDLIMGRWQVVSKLETDGVQSASFEMRDAGDRVDADDKACAVADYGQDASSEIRDTDDEVWSDADRGQAGGRCFVMKREAVWRRQGECIKHTETLFPGYVFVDTENPQELYQSLKKVPKFAKLLGKSELTDSEKLGFVSVLDEEKKFLENLLDGDPEDTVRLSPVKTVKNGEIVECGGALRHYKDRIVKKRIRLRYVIVRVPFLGQEKDILLGINLEGDYELEDA